MNRPIIFDYYHHDRAETQFPLINPRSSGKEIDDTAWQYTIDLLRNDPVTLQEALIGEYYESMEEMEIQVQVAFGMARAGAIQKK